jgi:hypothetical protein
METLAVLVAVGHLMVQLVELGLLIRDLLVVMDSAQTQSLLVEAVALAQSVKMECLGLLEMVVQVFLQALLEHQSLELAVAVVVLQAFSLLVLGLMVVVMVQIALLSMEATELRTQAAAVVVLAIHQVFLLQTAVAMVAQVLSFFVTLPYTQSQQVQV